MNKFLFIGLNYKHLGNRHIDTTTNVFKLIEYIKTKYRLSIDEENIVTDNKDKYRASYQGILLELHKLALETWNKQIDNVFLYYTGDSINILEYIYSYKNAYNVKQGIVPSDYKDKGIISKEDLKMIIEQFNPTTRIILISDCCYTTANILGLKYTWSADTDIFAVENESIIDTDKDVTKRKIITISYVLQSSKTDEDNFFNVLSINEKINSLADYITKLDNKNDNIFSTLKDINDVLQMKKINMKPTLSASYNILNENTNIFNYLDNANSIRSSFEEYKKNSYTVVNQFKSISQCVNDMEEIINEPKQINSYYDYTAFRPIQNHKSDDEPNLSHSFTTFKRHQQNSHSNNRFYNGLSRSYAYTKPIYECYC